MKSEEIKILFLQFESSSHIEGVECRSAQELQKTNGL